MSISRLMQMGAAAPTGPEGAWDLSYAYYDPPAAWDVSTGRYTGKSFSVDAQETNAQGLFFKPDGTKMYVVGQNSDAVNEYDLSTAWDVSTASYLQNFSVITQEVDATGLFFKPDGLKMYVIGTAGDDVNEYDLSTAWDVSTASFLQNFSVAAQETAPTGVFFKPDGLKMYVVGNAGDDVNEYDLSIAWDVSSASYLQNFSVSAQENNPQGVFFKPDGLKMYILGNTGLDVNEYDLSTAWDVSTASYLQNFSISDQENVPTGFFFKPDGKAFYIVGAILQKRVYQYDLGGFSIAAQETTPTGLFFKPDGLKMYIVGNAGDDVNEYDLSTAWDISTASYLQNFSVAAQETAPPGVFFKPDGLKMYIVGTSGDDVNEYDLSTAWDISTASYLQNFSVAAQETAPTGLFFKPDGLKMYVAGFLVDGVNEYDLSTAWDISTASFLQNFSVAAQETAPTGVFFKPDGLKMYVVGQITDAVFSYTLGPQD